MNQSRFQRSSAESFIAARPLIVFSIAGVTGGNWLQSWACSCLSPSLNTNRKLAILSSAWSS